MAETINGAWVTDNDGNKVAAKTFVGQVLSNDGTKNLDTILASKPDTTSLPAVAKSGSYNDLTNKPTLSTVATSGSYNDLSNKPSTATTSANGFMSSADKTKLDGIATGANKTTIANNLTTTTAGSALDATQGKALNDKFGSYLPLSGGTMTGTLKIKNGASNGVANEGGSLILRDHGNKNVTLDATGGSLYLGYQNTTSLNFMNSKATMDTSGNFTTAGTATVGSHAKLQYNATNESLDFVFV